MKTAVCIGGRFDGMRKEYDDRVAFVQFPEPPRLASAGVDPRAIDPSRPQRTRRIVYRRERLLTLTGSIELLVAEGMEMDEVIHRLVTHYNPPIPEI